MDKTNTVNTIDKTRYDAIGYSAEGVERSTRVKELAERLARELDQVPGRPASVALTHLQTAVMFANRAIAETFQQKPEAPTA